MSYHFRKAAEILPGVLSRAQDRVRSPVLWMASTPLPHLQRLVFLTVGGLCLAKKSACPSQRALGAMFDRTPRTIRRAIEALRDQGLIRVVRRGNTLTNVYLLARRIWRAITGQDPPRWKDRQLHLRLRESLARGVSPPRAVLEALKLPDDP